MNYEAKRRRVFEVLTKAEKMGELLEYRIIMSSILKEADSVAKVDIIHANGILDRLLKSEYCTYLMEGRAEE